MEDTPQLRSQLRELVVDRLALDVEPDDLDDSANLMDEYGADSVGLFWIVVGLDEEMGVQVGEDEFDLERFSSVQNLAKFLAEREE
jgi:acyl carrier protein